MESNRKKELRNMYENKEAIGGVYCIRCTGNNKIWLRATNNMDGHRNRFNFAMDVDGCPEPAMRRERSEFGLNAFVFEVLEELKKKEDQTDKEFMDDINVLLDIWKEKVAAGEFK